MSQEVRAFYLSLMQVVLLTIIIVGLIFLVIPPDPQHYFAGSLLQVDLLEKTSGPLIILIGGSNVSFGLDAEMIQRELSITAINDGLHAGLGVAPLRELKQYIHEGDIIIVSLEYSMFSAEGVLEGDSAFLSDWIEYAPRRVGYLTKPWKETPGIYGTMLQRKVNRKINTFLFGGSLDELRTVFTGSEFNANGDFIGHLQDDAVAPNKIPPSPYPVSASQGEIFTFLDEFYQFARSLGAQVYFEAPASRQTNCAATGESRLLNYYKTLEQKSSIPMITPFEQICMPDKYFFDTPYHLNKQGRELRTKRLIENLLGVGAVTK